MSRLVAIAVALAMFLVVSAIVSRALTPKPQAYWECIAEESARDDQGLGFHPERCPSDIPAFMKVPQP